MFLFLTLLWITTTPFRVHNDRNLRSETFAAQSAGNWQPGCRTISDSVIGRSVVGGATGPNSKFSTLFTGRYFAFKSTIFRRGPCCQWCILNLRHLLMSADVSGTFCTLNRFRTCIKISKDFNKYVTTTCQNVSCENNNWFFFFSFGIINRAVLEVAATALELRHPIKWWNKTERTEYPSF